MRRSDSRSGLARSNSTRSMTSNAETNAARSAAAAAASALAAAQRRTSIDITSAARPSTAPSALQRRDSVGSIRSNTTAISNRPGQYSAVRQTGSRRLYGAASTTSTAKPQSTAVTAARLTVPKTQTTQLRESMRSKPPQSASNTRRQNNMSSNASIRSFQSDLERINEDYNKTYAYAGQTSASAMKTAAATTGRPRRADSVISSAMSDTSEAPGLDVTQRKKASRVSFSDIDENEMRSSRNPSPNPERRKSAMKQSPAKSNGTPGRGIPASTLMPPPQQPQIQRRASNSSIRSNTSAARGNNPALLPGSQQVPMTGTAPITGPAGEDGELSTIASNSAYSDADEDFKPSPALQRHGILSPSNASVPLTSQNLAAVGAQEQGEPPLRSAMKKPASQTGSERFQKLETDSQLDVADDESDDSFAARRKQKQIRTRGSLTTLRGPKPTTSAASNGLETRQAPIALQRSASYSSQQTRTSQEPSRMVSLRQQRPGQQRRHSLQVTRQTSSDSATLPPAIARRTSLQSLSTAQQPPIPPKSVRRASVAGSIAESVRADAVTQHVAVMELAQRRVQKMLHPDADESGNAVSVYADATERKRSSFERKRPTTLSRQNSSSSMIDRSFRTSLRPESNQRAPEPTQHRRAASDDRAFATTLRGPKAPPAPRSSSMFVPSATTAADTQSMPATPKKSGRRMSFAFGRSKKNESDTPVPPMPAMRRYSSDSEDARPGTNAGHAAPAGSALSAGTLRAPKSSSNARGRPTPARYATDTSLEEKTTTSAKPKRFQAIRRLFKMKN